MLLFMGGCGSNTKPTAASTGQLSGNWQLSLLQEEPRPTQTLGVSGFLQQSSDGLTGNFVFPQSTANGNCAGVANLTGTVNAQSVQLTANESGTVITFTGNISSDGKSMSGNYQGLGGSCFTRPTTGTWNAVLIPELNGSFTGNLSNSSYMPLVNGVVPPAPVQVTGKLTQSANIGASNATLQGSISATNYPCFSTASLSGTITGANVILSIFSQTGVQIGTIGLPGSPASVSSGSQGPALTGTAGTTGLSLGGSTPTGVFGPCPPLLNSGGSSQPFDSADVSFTFGSN